MGLDFLGIGAQKSATSWLFKNMRNHPDIWLPPRKELHYFDRMAKGTLPSASVINRFTRNDKEGAIFRKAFVKDLGKAVLWRDLRHLQWTFLYYCGSWDDDWYLSLFDSSDKRLKGEITPAYSTLGPHEVQKIRNMSPCLKIIFIMRNPIERAWSHARFEWTRGEFRNIDDLERVKKFIDGPAQSLRSDYVRTLDVWSSCFPPEQIYIGFYDKVVNDPKGFMEEIYDFLGVDQAGSDQLIGRINVSKSFEIPVELKRYLAKKYHSELRRLTGLVGGYSAEWLREAEEILNTQEDLPDRCSQVMP